MHWGRFCHCGACLPRVRQLGQVVVQLIQSTSNAGSNAGLAPCLAPEVIAIGPWRQREFAYAKSAIDPNHSWFLASTIDDAMERLGQVEKAPEVALLAQPFPGYYDAQAAVRLQRAAPLLRSVVVAGSWCEGERRTGQPLLGAMRLYWHQLPAWWRRGVALWAAGRTPPWSQPLGEAAWNAPASLERQSRPGGAIAADRAVRVLIAGNDSASFKAYAAALAPSRCTCQRIALVADTLKEYIAITAERDAVVGIWDGRGMDDRELGLMQRFCGAFPQRPAPVVALVDAPRVQDISRAQAAGASSLLGKPLDIVALEDEVRRLSASALAAIG